MINATQLPRELTWAAARENVCRSQKPWKPATSSVQKDALEHNSDLFDHLSQLKHFQRSFTLSGLMKLPVSTTLYLQVSFQL